MPLFNTLLIVALAGFALYGLWFGLIHTFGALLGTVVGALAAANFYNAVALWMQGIFGGNLNVHRAIAFLLVFAVVNRLVGLVFLLLEKMFQVLAILPFLKSINRLLGAIFGLLEGAIVIGATLLVIQRFPFGGLQAQIAASPVAQTVVSVARVVILLLPPALRDAIGLPPVT